MSVYLSLSLPHRHTYRQELPDDVKKRLYVVHVSESSIPKDSGLKVAPAGVENTLRLKTEVNPHLEAIAVLELICSVGILKDISAAQVRALRTRGWLSASCFLLLPPGRAWVWIRTPKTLLVARAHPSCVPSKCAYLSGRYCRATRTQHMARVTSVSLL